MKRNAQWRKVLKSRVNPRGVKYEPYRRNCSCVADKDGTVNILCPMCVLGMLRASATSASPVGNLSRPYIGPVARPKPSAENGAIATSQGDSTGNDPSREAIDLFFRKPQTTRK